MQRKLKHADVATKIGVSGKDVEMIEARKWPPPLAEWFPALKELFAPPRGAKAKPAPMPKKAKPPTTAKADKAAAQTAKKTAQRLLRARPKRLPSQRRRIRQSKLLRPDKTQSRGWRRLPCQPQRPRLRGLRTDRPRPS